MMKKTMPVKLKFIEGIALLFGFIFAGVFLWVVSITIYDTITLDTHKLYMDNLGIDIPNPEKSKYIIDEGGIDWTALEILYYSNEDIQKLKEKDFFLKIEGENSSKINKDYKELVTNCFVKSLDNKEKKIFENQINPILLNENNYYALFEKNERWGVGYCFTILLLDTENNIMYSIIWTS